MAASYSVKEDDDEAKEWTQEVYGTKRKRNEYRQRFEGMTSEGADSI